MSKLLSTCNERAIYVDRMHCSKNLDLYVIIDFVHVGGYK